MKKWTFYISVMLILLISACTSSGSDSGSVVDSTRDDVPVVQAESNFATLNTDYEGAISVQAQLAIGTLQLEETGLAVDEALASELLPLWRAVQSLSGSDTAADAEIEAVLNQIQETMSAAQIVAITEMSLTEDALTEMQESGELSLGRAGNASEGGFGDPGDGGGPGGGGFGGPGGGGGFGGPGGGGFGGPGAGGDFDEDALATRQAQFAENGPSAFLERATLGGVIRLLEDKTGDLSEERIQGQVFADALTAVSVSIGLTQQEIQQQVREGKTMAEILEENGGDVAEVQTMLVDIFNDLPDADELDLEQTVADWLGLTE